MSWSCPGMLKSRNGMVLVSNRWESRNVTSSYLQYWACSQTLVFLAAFIDTLPVNTCETHLRNAQVNKASSVNKGIVKISLVVDMVRQNWSWIVAAGCGLHHFLWARFGSFWVFSNFSTAERFNYLFFTAIKIHTNTRIVKKQNNFIFSSLVT